MKHYELWIKPFMGEMEVHSKHQTLELAELAMDKLAAEQPNWKVWVETTAGRERLRALGEESCPEYFD
jgi:hypothetical protein